MNYIYEQFLNKVRAENKKNCSESCHKNLKLFSNN